MLIGLKLTCVRLVYIEIDSSCNLCNIIILKLAKSNTQLVTQVFFRNVMIQYLSCPFSQSG